MSKILALCETPYQIIVVSQIVSTLYKESEVDIIVTNHINGGDKLVERLKKSRLFNDAFYLETKNIGCNFGASLINYSNKYLKTKKLAKEVGFKSKKYDTFLFANIDVVVQHFIDILSEHNKVNSYIYEDGLSTYTDIYGSFFNNYVGQSDFINKIKYRVLRSNFAGIKGMYVFNPQYVLWNSYFPIYEIPKITTENRQLIDELNNIFSYSSSINEYESKYIFFEESYYADGYSVNDIELVDQISDVIGKDNLVIKIHPRNPINRFEKHGYKTNKNTSIPWEIVALNMNLEEKILITIASGSVMNPLIIMGIDLKAIMLFEYEGLSAELLNDLIGIISLICKTKKEHYFIPKTNEDMRKLLFSK